MNMGSFLGGTMYIPPEKSNYFEEEFSNNHIINFSSQGNIITVGDINARTSKLEL